MYLIGEGEREKIFTIFDEINFIGPARREMILPYGLQLKAIAEKKLVKLHDANRCLTLKKKTNPGTNRE